MSDSASMAHAGTIASAPPSSGEAEPPPQVAGYEIECELGRGGMGVVYRAVQTELGRKVALKMILAGHAQGEELARFTNEARAVALLQHPNIVQVYEIGEHAGRPFFSLEFVKGGNLEESFAGKPQPWRKAAKLVATLARAMHAAHVQGIVHRDLKPANVLLTPNGTPKITDFGIAKRLDAQRQTQTGKILGTPCYMAPEQALGRNDLIGPGSDIYSLGAILYDAITGRPPFLAETTMDTLMQSVTREPLPPRELQPKIPRDLEVICLKCLEKTALKRYASALALAEDLERLLAGRPIVARPIGPLERAARWAKRNPAWATLFAVSSVAAGALLTASLWFTHELKQELAATERARRAATEAEGALRVQLVRSRADGIDSDLRQLAGVPRAVAAGLAERADFSEVELTQWLRSGLSSEPAIFGMAIAFEPGQFRPNVRDFALYVYRGNGLEAKQLLPPSYTPLYREWSWYRDARTYGGWGEPYVDKGGGNIPMVTFSVPFERAGKRAGVVTADLSLDYFRALDAAMRRSRFGQNAYAFVTTGEGTLVSHPDARLRFPAPESKLTAEQRSGQLWSRLLNGETGEGHATDLVTGKPAALLFAPVKSAGWVCVAVVPD